MLEILKCHLPALMGFKIVYAFLGAGLNLCSAASFSPKRKVAELIATHSFHGKCLDEPSSSVSLVLTFTFRTRYVTSTGSNELRKQNVPLFIHFVQEPLLLNTSLITRIITSSNRCYLCFFSLQPSFPVA